jgi:hypothetical protein
MFSPSAIAIPSLAESRCKACVASLPEIKLSGLPYNRDCQNPFPNGWIGGGAGNTSGAIGDDPGAIGRVPGVYNDPVAWK